MENLRIWEEKIENIRWQNVGNHLWFRGHSCTSYLLKPTITRDKHTVETLITKERQELGRLSEVPSHELGVYVNDTRTFRNEWILLMQAQHLGYQTRLIDWTINLRIALFFAVENEKYFNEDGCLCILTTNNNVWHDEQISKISPKDISETILVNAARSYDFNECLGERRRTLQMGMFSISPYAESMIPLEKNEYWNPRILKETIHRETKKALKLELKKCGITSESIYVRQLK